MKTARELRAQRANVLAQARALVEAAEGENRDFTSEEQTQYDGFISEADQLDKRAMRLESLPGDLPQAPAINRTGLGDNEGKAFAHYFRTGDDGGIRELRSADEKGQTEYRIRIPKIEQRATDEAFTSAATEGGPAIPTGLVPRITARRNEIELTAQLGCQNIPGVGLTVNAPYENADAVVFAATSEQVDAHSNTYERDRPTLATKAFTLAKKTKKLELTEEVLEDEDAALMNFIGDHIGRGIALTKNSMLLTEAAASGTALKTFASATAIAAGEPEDLVYHDTLGNYLDDGQANAWVMKRSTFGKIKKLTGDARQYDETAMGSGNTLINYPVRYSAYAGAVQASAKSVFFGNWWYMGYREGTSIGFIRDPYTVDGMVILKYSFRAVYGVLIAGAIGYGAHPTA